jgi:DNA-binding Lrp family transcriptional regulator
LKDFREYVSTMQAMNLIKSYRIIQTGDTYTVFPDFDNYRSGSGEWRFDWEQWLNEIKTVEPTEKIQDPKDQSMEFEKVDLEIMSYLQDNGRMNFTDIADKVNISPQSVKYHYDRALASGSVLGSFDFLLTPYPLEVSSFHEFMLEFPDAASMNRFYSVVKKLFFVHQVAKVIHKNVLLVRTRILDSQVGNIFTFFSEMVNAGQLDSYSSVRLNMNTRSWQTISYELFDDATGWQWDVYKNLLELNKL